MNYTPNNDPQYSLEKLGKGKLFKKGLSQPNPYQVLSDLKPIMSDTTETHSIHHQLSLTLWHVIRDVLMPLRIQAPENSSLAVVDLHQLLAGKSVYTYAFKEMQHLIVSLQDVIINYFLKTESAYMRMHIDSLELLMAGRPSGVQGEWYYDLLLMDGTIKRCTVSHAVVVRGVGSSALENELTALFQLRSQLFKGIKHATAYSHKVIVQVEGLTALMAEASSDPRMLDRIKFDLNQQVTSLFTSPNDLALLDSRTKITSFHLEVGQLEEINNYIYSELARMLQVPKTKLLGQAAGGLNATGAYDYQHYQDYLESIRTHVIYPFLDAMDIYYSVIPTKDLKQVKEALELLRFSKEHLSFLPTDTIENLQKLLLAGLQID